MILKALQEKEIFIGLHMLCRYLNGRGYQRFGCNAKYDPPYGPNDKINPCPVLCKNSKNYPVKIRYWVMKLFREGKLYTNKTRFYDSKNPNSKTAPMKTDLFRFIAINKETFDNIIKKNTMEAFL